MTNVGRALSTLVLFVIVFQVAFPFTGNAQSAVFTSGSNFTSDLYTWNDPVYPDPYAPKPSLRSSKVVDCEEEKTTIDGDITDLTDKKLLAGARVFCLNKDQEVVASVETDSSGCYQFQVPKGQYTFTVSKLKYVAATKEVSVTGNSAVDLNFDLSLVKTSAGYLQVLNGSLAEGSQKDITLENSKIAMTIADGSSDSQLGLATKGKPIDLSTTGGIDGFDWINLPLITKQKVSGLPGSAGSQSNNVRFSTVKIIASTPTVSKVLAEGECTDMPLTVENLYVVKPEMDWFDVTTTIRNESESAVSFWLGDAMDNDEDGQTSLYPMKRFGSNVIVSTDSGLDEYIPAEPWMGCFGKSNQVFGIFYKGDYAKGFVISANTYRTVSQKYITLQPGESYYFRRQIAAVPVKKDQTHSLALRSCFESNYEEWGLSSVLRISKNNVNPGDTIECSLTITNVSKSSLLENVSGTISLPPYWKGSADTIRFGNMLPSTSVEAKWKLIPTEGSGTTIISAQALAWDEPFTYSDRTVFVNGEGWYAGDNHLHTKFSDGWGSVTDNVIAAKAMGLSFISCTDHNTTIQDSAVKANCTPEFLVMTGCEVTPNYKAANNWGHAVSLFSNKMIPYSNTQSQANAQAIVNNINALNDGNGYAIMGHPFLKGSPWIYTNVTGFKGVEVWTCFTPIGGAYSKQAFELWDKKNNAGLKQFGYAESDAHNLDMVGKPHIVAHLKNLSQVEVENAMRKGQFFGTNGPSIRFTVDTVQMGGSLTVNSKRTVKITMKAYSSLGIDSMYVYRNGMLIRGFSYDDYRPSVQQILYDEAVPGDFYRMECTDRWNLFAFSNPVFIVPAEQVSPLFVDTVSTGLSLGDLKIGLSPNPASDFVQLKTNIPSRSMVALYDIHGKLVLNVKMNDEIEKLLDVRSLPRGWYVLKIDERRLKLVLN